VTQHPFAARPVPLLRTPLTTALSRTVPVDLSDPRARERLVDVRELGVRGESFYARADGSNPPYHQPLAGAISGLLLRESVAGRVAEADRGLRRHGFALFVLDGYRPIATQQALWDFFWMQIGRDEPGLSEPDRTARVATFVSDPRAFRADDPRTWTLHCTGGAVDTLLCGRDGAPLDMGAAFDDATPASATDHFERLLENGRITPDDPRLAHRRIHYWAMREAGLTNYPHEYWHFDWGNQMHVLALAAEKVPDRPHAAWYGPAPAGAR